MGSSKCVGLCRPHADPAAGRARLSQRPRGLRGNAGLAGGRASSLRSGFVVAGSLFDSEAFGELSVSAKEEEIKIGAAVRVAKEVRVFHITGAGPDGYNLEGNEGVVVSRADDYEGRPTTANLPYKVKFQVEVEGKNGKVKTLKTFAHLTKAELERCD